MGAEDDEDVRREQRGPFESRRVVPKIDVVPSFVRPVGARAQGGATRPRVLSPFGATARRARSGLGSASCAGA